MAAAPLFRLIVVVGVTLAVAACATKPQRRRMLPLDIVGADGSWRASIRGETFTVQGGPKPLVIRKAGVLSAGRNSVLLNSRAPGGRYVSLLVEEAPCRGAGRASAFTARLWISENYPRFDDQVALTGCAFPRGARR